MSALDDYAENDDRAAHLDGRAACRRCRCRARRSTPCACRSIRTSCRRRRSASTKSIRRSRTGTSTCRPASCSARTSTFNIKAGGQLMNADAFRPIVVAYRNGAPVRLEQVANVIDSVEDIVNAALVLHARPRARQRAITLQVMRQPGSNTIEVTDAVRALLPAFEAQLPPSVHLTSAAGPVEDHPRGVQRHPVDDARHAGARRRRHLPVPAQRLGDAHSGAGAAVLDPRHLRRDAGAATSASNNLSMMALILSIGFVVDDAIVMLENIVRHMEDGESAARGGARRARRKSASRF